MSSAAVHIILSRFQGPFSTTTEASGRYVYTGYFSDTSSSSGIIRERLWCKYCITLPFSATYECHIIICMSNKNIPFSLLRRTSPLMSPLKTEHLCIPLIYFCIYCCWHTSPLSSPSLLYPLCLSRNPPSPGSLCNPPSNPPTPDYNTTLAHICPYPDHLCILSFPSFSSSVVPT